MNKKKYQFVVNTATSCFLCFQELGVVKHDLKSFFSLRSLCRHLKIDLSRVIPLKDKSLLPILPKMNVKVSLCPECELVSEKYSQVYRELEGIRMRLGICLEAINGKIMGAWKRPELLEAYRKKVEGNRQAKLHSWMVEKLRKEVMVKCHSQSKRSQPRIRIRKIPDFQPEPKVSDSDIPQIIQVRSLRPDPDNIQTPAEEETPDIICVYMDAPINNGDAQPILAPSSVTLSDIIPIQQIDPEPEPPVLSILSVSSSDNQAQVIAGLNGSITLSSSASSPSFICQYCNGQFSTLGNRDRHIRYKHCPVWKATFRNILPRPPPPPPNLLQQNPPPSPSNLLPPSSPPPSNIVFHPPSANLLQFPTPPPSNLLPQQPPSPSKVMMGHGGRPCTCILCGAQFDGKEGLKSHIMLNHREDPRLRKMISDISQQRSTSPNKNPPVTVNVSSPDKVNVNISSPVSVNVTASPPPMAVSRKRVHSEGNTFSCRFCSESFRNQALLLRHERFYCNARNQKQDQGPGQNELSNPILNQLLSKPLPPEPIQNPPTETEDEPRSEAEIENSVTVQNMEVDETVNDNGDNANSDSDSDAESDSSDQTLMEDFNGGQNDDETEWVTGIVEMEDVINIDPLA